MNNSSAYRNMFSASIWGIIAKIFDALSKFLTIPLLIGYYGQSDYGLIALSFSLNAYLRLMDLGMNTGAIRFFSMWVAEKQTNKIISVSQSSIVFYGVIGFVNALIFVVLAFYADQIVDLTTAQYDVFKLMMYILAMSAVFNWTAYVVTQLLSAYGEISWINQTTILSSILNLGVAFLAVKINLSLSVYFLLFTLSTLVVIPLNIGRLRRTGVLVWQLLKPKWNYEAFKEILKYSMAIFAMGAFAFSADNLRPLLLGAFSIKGVSVLTDYRVIQTIAMLVVAFGTVFMQVLLPALSKSFSENDVAKTELIIYRGTKYIAAFLSLIVFLLCINTNVLLTLYVGAAYGYLSIWLVIWLLTVLLAMHNAPVASLVLSSGKTKFLVYSSGISCLVSLPLTVVLVNRYDVGAAVIGYLVYILIQMAGYYFYYIPRVLKLDPYRIFFKSFMPSVVIGVLAAGIVVCLLRFIRITGNIKTLVVTSGSFCIIYCLAILLFVIKKEELSVLKVKLTGRQA